LRREQIVDLHFDEIGMAPVEQPLSDAQVHEAIGTVVLEQTEAEHTHDLEGALPRQHAKRRQRSLRRQHFDAITQADAQLLREVLSKDDARHGSLDRRQSVEAPRQHGLPDVGHAGLERRIDALERNELDYAGALRQAKSEDDRRRGHDTRHGTHFPDLLVRLSQPSSLEHVDMRRRADDAITQLALKAGHQRKHDEERHHADGHADGGDQRIERNERLFPAGQQVADSDEELEGEAGQSLLINGNRMTSRSEALLVNSMRVRTTAGS
jgi:hypothetical protein